MASYMATMDADGTGWRLDRVNFFAARDRDNKGRPVPNLAWTIMISIYSSKETVFTEWMLDPTKKKDITISFSDGAESQKKWDFKQAFCVGFEESFIDDLGIMETIIILSGQAVSNGNATLTYDWAT